MQTLTTRKFWSLLAYQALVPKLCPECCEPADRTIPNLTAFIRQRFHIDTSAVRTRRMGGCAACRGRGVRGVTVVAEMMQPTRPFLRLMREGRDFEAEAAWRSASDGRFDSPHMRGKTVFEHALYKAYCGMIDPRTVETFELFDQFEIIREVT
jgi:type II secretory ATPase GspE/PulE/Tfp pilus assembly ATPase PilB-like protein